MWELRVCAACLATDVRLHNMSAGHLHDMYRTVSGLQFQEREENEGMPQKLCFECAASVSKFHSFRHKCERAHRVLRQMYDQHDEITEERVQQVDRKELKFASPLSYTKTYSVCFGRAMKRQDKDKKDKKHKTRDKEKQEEIEIKSDDGSDGDHFADADYELDIKPKDELDSFDLTDDLPLKPKREGALDEPKDEAVKDLNAELDNYEFEINIKEEALVNALIPEIEPVENKHINLEFVKEEKDSLRMPTRKPAKRKPDADSKKENVKIRKMTDRAERKNKRSKVKRKPVSERVYPNRKMDVTEFATEVLMTHEQQIEDVRKRQDKTGFKEAAYKCMDCFKGFVYEKAYNNHMLQHDTLSGDFQCDICKIRFHKRHLVFTHIYKVHTSKYLCKFCPYISQTTYQANTHYKWHKGVTYKCKLCNEEFTKKTTYLSHLRIKHPSDYICKICGESFVSKLGLCQHTTRLHKETQEDARPTEPNAPYCVECDVQFTTHEAYQRHLMKAPRHAQEKKTDNVCRDCGETLSSERELKMHRRKLHRRQKVALKEGEYRAVPAPRVAPVQCAFCEEVFSDGKKCWHHFRRAHPGEKYPSFNPAICEFCGKGFKCNAVLEQHKKIHSGKRAYACPLCPKTFFNQISLDLHGRSHSENRPHVCHICRKGFKIAAALSRHMRIHTGEKPYVCDVCGKAFSDSSGRKVHVRTVHLKEPTPYVSKARMEKRRAAEQMKITHLNTMSN